MSSPFEKVRSAAPGQISALFVELNILRRNVSAYPQGHPLVAASAAKVLALVDRFAEEGESLMFGVARDALLLGERPLDQKNRVFRDLAQSLFSRGIVAVSIRRNVESKELIHFFEVLARSREVIREQGGICRALAEAGVAGIEASEMDLSLLRVTDEEQIKVDGSSGAASQQGTWHRYVQGLLDGTLDPFGDVEERRRMVTPELLADMLNSGWIRDSAELDASCGAIVQHFLRGMEREQGTGRSGEELAEKLAELATRLHPDLRSQLLQRAFSVLADSPAVAEQLLSTLPEEMVAGTLNELNERNETISPTILNLCRKLSSLSEPKTSDQSADPGFASSAAVGRTLGGVVSSGGMQQYMPDTYQRDLHGIVALDAVTVSGLADGLDLKESLLDRAIEAKVGDILLEIVREPLSGDDSTAIRAQLTELCIDYLETGNFPALHAVCGAFSASDGTSTGNDPAQRIALTALTSPRFVDSLVEAPSILGKEHFSALRTLMLRIGWPCVPPLLDRLAEEESMSLRRYYMECLSSMGGVARDLIMASLDDERWYFVRNLIIILGESNDSSVAERLRPLLRHKHPRVWTEALRVLIRLCDPEAERRLLRDLSSSDRLVVAAAVPFAERSRNPEVREALLLLVRKDVLSGPDYDIRCAAVRALGEIGSSEALPDLARLLREKSLLRSAPLNRLKVEIVRSLRRYPAADVLPLLEEAQESHVPELEATARETARVIRRRTA